MTTESAEVRFGPIRSAPPETASRPEWSLLEWTRTPLGGEGPYPNGGLWRFDADRVSLGVKRTGAPFLGGDPVWRLSRDANDPQWWGREAAFYESELARSGWGDACRPVDCMAVERHGDEADLWLEWVDGIPLPADGYSAVAEGLASWQATHVRSRDPVLSHGWLAHHVARRGLDNATTLAHPRWDALLEAGLHEDARRWVSGRLTDARTVADAIAEFPQLPTHHDLHGMNLGSDGPAAVILDWATVGWGPVGHDIANLALDRAAEGDLDVRELWSDLLDVYGRALRSAGVDIAQPVVERSAAASSTIRMGWLVDFLLERSASLPPSELRPFIAVANHLASLAVADEWSRRDVITADPAAEER